eukprot:scaffold7403_cov277-Pinguiococcus_pyrenoidosus.AAC.7
MLRQDGFHSPPLVAPRRRLVLDLEASAVTWPCSCIAGACFARFLWLSESRPGTFLKRFRGPSESGSRSAMDAVSTRFKSKGLATSSEARKSSKRGAWEALSRRSRSLSCNLKMRGFDLVTGEQQSQATEQFKKHSDPSVGCLAQ